MPRPRIVHAWAAPPTRTTALVAGDRLVVFQTEDGAAERGEMFDPGTDTWIPIASENAPRYGSFRDGAGPLSAPSYFAFEDWVVVLWFDGNHRPRPSGAVFDAHRNTWHAMSEAGMPDALGGAIEAGTTGVYVRLAANGVDRGHRYDVRANRWSAIPSAGGPPRSSPAIAAHGGKVVVWGGILGEPHGTGRTLDLATDAWTPMPTEGAPSGRVVAWSATHDGLLVTWSGTSRPGATPDLADGGVYAIASHRWMPIPAANAPDPAENVDPVFLAWTGEALAVRELPPGAPARSEPRRLAFWDASLGGWWRAPVATTWPVLPLGFGRVLTLEGSPHVVHAREKLACPASLPLPIFEHGPTAFTATALVGDELVVWGRVDSPSPPPCPPGAPCARWTPTFVSIDDGAVVSP